MTQFIDLIVSLYTGIFGKFNSYNVELGGYDVSLGSLLFVFIALFMIVSIYWRGAKG